MALEVVKKDDDDGPRDLWRRSITQDSRARMEGGRIGIVDRGQVR